MATPSQEELYGKPGSFCAESSKDVCLEEDYPPKSNSGYSRLLEISHDSTMAANQNSQDVGLSRRSDDTTVTQKDDTTKENSKIRHSDDIKSVSSSDDIGSADDIGKSMDEVDASPDFFDKISQYSLFMVKDARYYFQHPYARLFIAYLIVFCNFLIYAEDPVAHSVAECTIPAIGNAFAFIFTKYPPNHWSAIKVILWMAAIACGVVFGKLVVHRLFLKRLLRLEMFQEDQGSFMVMFLTTILSLFIFSWLYNLLLMIEPGMYDAYKLTGPMGINNAWFMKAAACGTWCGDFFTAWMVTDIMLQEKLYPGWAMPVRRWWRRGYNRIILFWCVTIVTSTVVVVIIATDIISWDTLNRGFLPSNELSRAMLASFILLMDLMILMQDWDFPHFVNSLDIKLPGLNVGHIHIEIPNCCRKRLENWKIHVEGKWFQYGVIFIVMILDLNMWKNQVFYNPYDYGQYTDPEHHVHTVTVVDQLTMFNKSQLTYDWRNNNTDPLTNKTYASEDTVMYSKFFDYPIGIQITAFIPSLAGGITFITLILIYGRIKPTKADPYVGRLKKRPKRKPLNIFTIVRMKLFSKKLVKNHANSVGDKGEPDTEVAGKWKKAGRQVTFSADEGGQPEVSIEADVHKGERLTSDTQSPADCSTKTNGEEMMANNNACSEDVEPPV